MNPLDDMFRDGLGGRKGEVPADMWSRIKAGSALPAPEGTELDRLFADGLKDHAGEVPPDMWARIAPAGVPAVDTVDQLFADGLRDVEGPVPIGMWDRVWAARAGSAFPLRRALAIAASLLLLLSVVWFARPQTPAVAEVPVTVESTVTPGNTMVIADNFQGGAAGTTEVVEAMVLPPAKPAKTTTAARTPNPPATPATDQTDANASSETNAGTPLLTEEQSSDATTAIEPDKVVTSGSGPRAPVYEVNAVKTLVVSPLLIRDSDLGKERELRPNAAADRPFRAAPRHRFQTEFLFGAFYAQQQFKALTEDQRIPREVRNLNESPDLSYQVTLRGAYELNERLMLMGGLTYAEIRNEFSYTRLSGAAVTDVRTTNRLRMLEAPLLLGFRMPGRRLQASLNAGPVVNLAFSARGRFIHPDENEPLNLATDANYRDNVGVGLMSSLSINYKIGKRDPFILLVEPFFKGYPAAFTIKGAPLRERYWAAGVQFGVRKGF